MVIASIESLEVLWSLIAISGGLFALGNAIVAARAVKWLNMNGISNGRLWVARSTRRSEFARVLIQSIYVAIGVTAFILPPGDPGLLPLKYRLYYYFVQWGLIASATVVAYLSINSFITRKYFYAVSYENGKESDTLDT